MYRHLLLITIGIVISLFPHPVFPQEEEMELGYGVVVGINESKSEIIVAEYDWDAGKDVDIVYSIAPDIKLENISKLSEIEKGDEVSIEYITKEDGKKIVKSLSVYKEESGFEESIPEFPDFEESIPEPPDDIIVED